MVFTDYPDNFLDNSHGLFAKTIDISANHYKVKIILNN